MSSSRPDLRVARPGVCRHRSVALATAAVLAGLGGALCSPAVLAQQGLTLDLGGSAQAAAPSAAPDTRAMIDALKPRQRNLMVRQRPEGASAPSAVAAEPTPAAAPGAAAQADAAPVASPTGPAGHGPAQPPVAGTSAGKPPGAKPPAGKPPSAAAAAAAGAAAAAAVAANAAASAAAAAAASEGPPPSLSLAVVFEPGSARIRSESGGLLGDLVAALLAPELRDSRFVIEGHTDAQGSPAANLRLSRERAEEVRNFLVTMGVPPQRLSAVGKGATEPLDRARPQAAVNRRVRVVTLN